MELNTLREANELLNEFHDLQAASLEVQKLPLLTVRTSVRTHTVSQQTMECLRRAFMEELSEKSEKVWAKLQAL